MLVCLRKKVRVLFWLIDVLCILLSFAAAMIFIWEGIPLSRIHEIRLTLGIVIFVHTVLSLLFGIYKNILKNAGIRDYVKIAGVANGAVLASWVLCLFIPNTLPLKINILAGLFFIMFLLGVRISVRVFAEANLLFKNKASHDPRQNLLIIGAGAAAKSVMEDIRKSAGLTYRIVGLVDDDPAKKGCFIGGKKVLGTRDDIIRICAEKQVDEILIAIPSANENELQKIISICSETNCKVRMLPSVNQIMYSDADIYNYARNIQIEDLLPRSPVVLHNEQIVKELQNKTVMITGGGGSIGSELCRQVIKMKPKKIIILDIYENNAYELQNELQPLYPDVEILVLIASVTDSAQLNSIFKKHRPHIVFHAAAHKHVPLMEQCPEEAVKNNVFGTYNVAKCADQYRTSKFILISTDKAVNPTNVMGATKRICEMIVQSMQQVSDTKFAAVRFGNVLGSNGSVVPLFQRQIKEGGPVTVTHEDVTRFFMTISEAVQLVLQASSYAEGGEIFVLDMGEPVKIYDLAEKLIKLSGYKPNIDIPIQITGLRPGEKLYEELSLREEVLHKTKHDKIFVGQPIFCDIVELKRGLNKLKNAIAKHDSISIKEALAAIVPTFSYKKEAKSKAEAMAQEKMTDLIVQKA